MEKQSSRLQLTEWLKEIVPYSNLDEYVRWKDPDEANFQRVIFCTDLYVYAIAALPPSDDRQHGYLGCVSSCRKMLAGEDWTRGRDLPDGPFSRETWESIKGAIIRHELVKLEPIIQPVSVAGMPTPVTFSSEGPISCTNVQTINTSY